MTNGGRSFWRVATLFIVCASVVPLFAQDGAEKRLANSAAALQQILSENNGLPKTILDKGYCVIIFPGVKKVAIYPDSSYGKGALVCRKGAEMDGSWGAPAMYALDMTSLDFQVGSTETDFVLVIVSQKGVDQVLNGKTKLGSNVAAAPGPTGARAASYYNVERNTDILIYARLKEPFAGVSLARASMGSDGGANKAIYGKDKGARDIVQGSQAAVPAAKPLVALLDKSSPMRK
jgi:SH3 domain-containing YSC84-like protein 1